jgi:hypothetical protein
MVVVSVLSLLSEKGEVGGCPSEFSDFSVVFIIEGGHAKARPYSADAVLGRVR